MDYEDMLHFVRGLDDVDLWMQLAEECVELSHAAMKMARIERGVNPTPVTGNEAMGAILEEYADVQLMADVMQLTIGHRHEVIDWQKEQKLRRWVGRLTGESDIQEGLDVD